MELTWNEISPIIPMEDNPLEETNLINSGEINYRKRFNGFMKQVSMASWNEHWVTLKIGKARRNQAVIDALLSKRISFL